MYEKAVVLLIVLAAFVVSCNPIIENVGEIGSPKEKDFFNVNLDSTVTQLNVNEYVELVNLIEIDSMNM